MTNSILLCLLVLGGAGRPARALELSLEENRADRGNIGYIDMQRLFKTYPETLKAKENFEEVVRQAEEQINLRKTEVLRLRHELADMKIEREFMAKTPLVVSSAPAVAPPPPKPAPIETPVLSTGSAAPAAPAVSTRAAALPLPGFSVPLSSGSAGHAPLMLPGVSTGPVVVQPPAAPPAPPPPPAPSLAPPPPAPTTNPALAELDAKIALKSKDLADKEAAFKEYQAAAEKNLLDLENRKTEILLGKINKAVQEVARKEGVSVVVDKSSILYGHDAVDLTEKVMKHLKGS